MQLVINGECVAVPDCLATVADLLAHFGLDAKPAIVELNRRVLTKHDHARTALADKDHIEIVHFVGGG